MSSTRVFCSNNPVEIALHNMLGELVAAGVLENRDEPNVLTRGIAEKDNLDGKTLEGNRRDHAAIAAMSRNGKLVIAAHSGHHVQLDEPELVIKSIRKVLVAAQK